MSIWINIAAPAVNVISMELQYTIEAKATSAEDAKLDQSHARQRKTLKETTMAQAGEHS